MTTTAPPPSVPSETIPGVTRRHRPSDLYHERTNFQFINRCARQQLTIDFHAFHHFLANFFLDDALHCFGNKLQIALIRDLKFDLVPDVRKKRPGIIPNDLVEHFLIGKANDATARMIARDVLPAKFPQRCVEVTDIDDVSGSVTYLDAITYAIRLANQNIYPADETFHRRLYCQADDN